MEAPGEDQVEKFIWQGRPAPRCYTFRLWKQAAAGSVLFLVSSFWLMLALQLITEGQPVWLALFPIPLVGGSFIFGPFQILRARWRWAKIFYRLTTSHLIISATERVDLTDITAVKTKRIGQQLASFKLEFSRRKPLVLHCIEHPDILHALLQQHCPGLSV